MRQFAKVVMFLFVTIALCSAAVAQGEQVSFSCQGEASYADNDMTATRQNAREAFLKDGVQKAVASMVDTEQLTRLQPVLNEKVYSEPDRYVLSYQIFSEHTGTDSFQVDGEVTVAMDALRADLVRFRVISEEQSEANAADSGQAYNAAETAPPEVQTGPVMHGQVSTSPREVLWAVLERWDGSWRVPVANDWNRSPFSVSVAQEMKDYGWNIVCPKEGTLAQSGTGEYYAEDARALAGAMGIPTLVLGRVYSSSAVGEKIKVVAELQVVAAASGQNMGTMSQDWDVIGGDSGDAALQLANLVVPGLDQIFSQAGQPEQDQSGTLTNWGASAASNEQILVLTGEHPYAVWEALEPVLKEQFQALRPDTMELGPGSIRVHLSGVSSESLRGLDGLKLNERILLQFSRVDYGQRAIYFNSVVYEPTEPEMQ